MTDCHTFHRSVHHSAGVSSAGLPTRAAPVSDGGGASSRQAVCPCGPDQPERRGKTSQAGTVGAKGPEGKGLHGSEGPGRPGCGRRLQDGRPPAAGGHRPEGKHAGEEEEGASCWPATHCAASICGGHQIEKRALGSRAAVLRRTVRRWLLPQNPASVRNLG